VRLASPVRQDGLLRWLACLVSRRQVSHALIAAVVTVDLTIPWQGLSFVPRAPIDEPCAVATALVVLGAVTRLRGAPPDPKFGSSLLVWLVLIDIDHLPLEFGSLMLTEGTPKPYTHSLWVVVVLIVATIVARYWSQRAKTFASAATVFILAGATWGISAHFSGTSQPLRCHCGGGSPTPQRKKPYWWYVLELLVIIAMPSAFKGKSVAEEQQPSENVVTLTDDRVLP
jgi:hypothetical protein